MKEINPHPDEAYLVGVDDHDLVVQAKAPKASKVWISKSMIDWIAKNGKQLIDDKYKKEVQNE